MRTCPTTPQIFFFQSLPDTLFFSSFFPYRKHSPPISSSYTMAFSDIKQLEEHLATRSYVDGYAPSQSDVGVFTAVGSAPSAAEYPHTARWYNHIKSWEAEHKDLPGDAAAASKLFGGASSSAPAAEEEDEDDIDLFGSDDEEEDAERERIKAERVAAYNEKKAAKGPAAVGKSVVTLDVKPWDDETPMEELETAVRSIQKEGLVWGASTLVAIGFGVKKLQITLVITDDVSLDEIQEEIGEFEDFVQSTDVQAMQKL